MSVDLDKLDKLGQADQWLQCPECGSEDCHVQQDPELIYFFCDGCDNYTDFEIARWR